MLKTDRFLQSGLLSKRDDYVAMDRRPLAGGGLPVALLFVFAIIALVQGANERVFEACGHELYNIVIANTVLSVGMTVVVSVLACCGFCCHALHGSQCISVVLGGLLYVMVTVAYGVMCGLTFQYSRDARDNADCVGNLTDTGSFKTTAPALIVVGYCFFVCDLLAVIGLGIAFFPLVCGLYYTQK